VVRVLVDTPDNKNQMANILDYVILPKKGRLSVQDKQIEHSQEFIESRRKHSAIESSINALENHVLDRCLDHSLHGFKRYVALSVLARNINIGPPASAERTKEAKATQSSIKRITSASKKST
jgi:hypothetical protein